MVHQPERIESFFLGCQRDLTRLIEDALRSHPRKGETRLLESEPNGHVIAFDLPAIQPRDDWGKGLDVLPKDDVIGDAPALPVLLQVFGDLRDRSEQGEGAVE